MKYLNIDDHHKDAECANDAIQSSELLVNRLSELEAILSSAEGADRIKPLLDSGYILLDLVNRKADAWKVGHEAFTLAVAGQNWLSAVEACDIIYQAEQDDAITALAHGIWLGVSFPIDPELSVAMLQHLVDETPDNSDGAGLAAATACYIVDLRAKDKQKDDLGFFTGQLLGQVARRHTNGACDTQELFDIWMDRLELKEPEKFLPRLAMVLDVLVPADKWWVDRDALRASIPE
ncbi:MAG: hypothetical protein ACNA75_03025 [Thiohalomonadaceae bacterium]